MLSKRRAPFAARRLVRQALAVVFTAAASIGLLACSSFDECSSDADCEPGFGCFRSSNGWESASVCSPLPASTNTTGPTTAPGDTTMMEIDPGCSLDCTGAVASVPGITTCDSQNVICALACEDGVNADCDGEIANGCEIDIANDDANCGACGTSCATEFADSGRFAGCAAGVCVATGCDEEAGVYDLNPDAPGGFDGCEVEVGDRETALGGVTINGLARPVANGSVGYEVDTGWLRAVDDSRAARFGNHVRETLPKHSVADDAVLDVSTIGSTWLVAIAPDDGTGWVVLFDPDDTDYVDVNGTDLRAVEAFDNLTGIAAEGDTIVVVDAVGTRIAWWELGDPIGGCGAGDVAIRDSCLVEVGANPNVDCDPGAPVGTLFVNGQLVAATRCDGNLQAFANRNSVPTGPTGVPSVALQAITPWRSSENTARGFATLDVNNEIRRFEVAVNNNLISQFASVGSPAPVPAEVGTPTDLISIGPDRFLIQGTDALFVYSLRAGETRLVRIDAPGVREIAFGPDGTALYAGATGMYRVPITVLEN